MEEKDIMRKKKLVSLLLSLIMIVTFVPVISFADDGALEESTPAIGEDGEVNESTIGSGGKELRDVEVGVNIEEYSFRLSKDKFFYDGKAHRPSVLNDELTEGIDYYVEYENYDSLEPGVYTVAVCGTSPNTGRIALEYQIVKTTIRAKSAVIIYLKGTYKIKPSITNPNGKTKYSTSNKKVAAVNKYGKITAKKAGKATITIKNGYAKMKVPVRVKKPHLNKKSVTIVRNKTKKLKIIGKVGKAKFSSTNTRIATVNSKGKIKAKSKGKCTIKVRTNGVTLKCRVTVKNPPPVYVYITKYGERYHCDYYCYGLRNARTIYKTTLQKAKSKGYTPCHLCY